MSDATHHHDRTGPDGGTAQGTSGVGSPVDRVKAEVERAKNTVEEVKTELSAALEARRGGPAKTPDEAAERLRGLREAMGRDLQALQGRAPDPTQISQETRRTALTVGGGTLAAVTSLAIAMTVRKRRKTRREADAEVERQAEALARALARIEADEPLDGADASGGLGKKLLLAAVVAAGAGAGGIAWRLRTGEPPEVFGPGAIDPVTGPDDLVD